MTAPLGIQLVLAPENVGKKFKGLEIMLFTNTAYTKQRYPSFGKLGFLYSALQSSIDSVVTASDIEISSLLNLNPLKHSKKSKIFLAIDLNLLIFYGH